MGRGTDVSIPACAGEPADHYRKRFAGAVYPRVCGGTLKNQELARAMGGLSPRVRGNHAPIRWARVVRRSIPACAGEP